MPGDRWQQLERLFTAAVAQPAAARAEFLTAACGLDARLLAELTSLVTAAEAAGDFLSAPAIAVFAQQISREGWSVQAGDRIGSYTVGRRLGAGGTGEVWRARDPRLGRDVAIKLLLPHPSASAAERVRAFQHEARAAGALNHTNVLTVYDIGEHEGAPYLVTECLDGEPLRARLGAGPLPIDTALDVALQVARGLAAAHVHGIVHRDLKPENVFLARDRRAKILDFGLATLLDAPRPAASSPAPFGELARSLFAGTAGYMAPEQIRGEAVDGRADIFALGVMLHEMLGGLRPFRADNTLGTLDAVLTREPADLSQVSPAIPPAITSVVRRCLAKSPDDRFATAADVVSALETIVHSRSRPPAPSLGALLRRPRAMVPIALILAAVVFGAWRWRVTASRAQWARIVAAPEIERLMNQGDDAEAFLLARQALDVLPDDPHLRQLWADVSIPGSVTSDPAGADVAVAAYLTTTAWVPFGRTPLDGVRLPRGQIRVRISKAGFQPIEAAVSPPGQRFRLDPLGEAPAGMVRVRGGRDAVRFGAVGDLEDFWIDRFEVTNREYKAFVDRGGYTQRAYWREPFVEDGQALPFEQAIERFRDTTGRPAPATWRNGTYPDGEADFPVGGVSWYEAAAYAVFAGKSLPTFYHWYRAANFGRFADILNVSNFDDRGPAPVGRYRGLGPFGTSDMAGNVKEWCWNAVPDRRRFLLGGGWNEAKYMFADADARGPLERAATYGFRLAKYIHAPSDAVAAPVPTGEPRRDVLTARPVSDEIFDVYRRQRAYDRTPLNAVVESTEESTIGIRVIVEFAAAYGGERMRASLFLPRTGPPPYQTVVFFPAGDAFVVRSSRAMSLGGLDHIVRGGRALLYPIYKGTYERVTAEPSGANGERDLQIAWSRDFARAIDYLDTRTDIDHARLAFYGVSVGADIGPMLVALEPRIRTAVLQGTGIAGTGGAGAPEVDPVNYAPRVRIPTLMLNGKYDFGLPVDTAQRPLFGLLGTREKTHRLFEAGHKLPNDEVAAEMRSWLDRYLGPVVR
ncbi:MAG TPA: protein kinase [Vicinamibacterales bacterium]|jgi:dienelactone hydrolase